MPTGPTVGQNLGHYRIVAKIGAGGMGEVFRARDTRLDRDVALKLLPPVFSSDQERLRRFEQEARATAALNHPNILVIYDVGEQDGSPYIVSELLEGLTLRQRLQEGPLPVRTALDYAAQIARGLVAAHEKHIAHRDLKPENLFLTRDGRVKILDFGIAKLTRREATAEGEAIATAEAETLAGVVLGTVGYMSPEQVRGKPVDHRTDLFSFGAILYEMLSGRRAFQGDTAADTITAILKEEPPELSQSAARSIPPNVERIVRHCLEKEPEERFQSARDLLFDLEMLSSVATASTTAVAAPRSWRRLRMAVPVLLLVVIVGLGLALMLRPRGTPLPSYHQLTFRRGTVWSARFTSDGHTIVYSAAWGGAPTDIFSARAESTESRSLGIANAQLLAVSPSGELAVLLRSQSQNFFSRGTLARVPLGGGAPREVLEDVAQADWSPDGQDLAIVRYAGDKLRLEYPIGHTLYETDGAVARPRVSPDGQKIAFLEQQSQWDTRGWVAVIDVKTGAKTRLSGEWADEQGLSWSPQGDEVWFTASKAGEAHALYAVSLAGRERVIARAPTALMLHDTSRDGNVLLTAYYSSTPIIGLAPGAAAESDLSWIDGVGLYDLSRDGKTFLFQYWGEGSGPNYASYLRKTDGSPAVRLGDGAGIAISPDGKWVVAVMNTPPQTVLLPTGAGHVRKLDRSGIESYGNDRWFPDSQQVVFTGFEPGHLPRTYAQDIGGGRPRPLTPEGITGALVSPDGKFILVRNREGEFSLFSLTGGPSRRVPGLTVKDRVAGWGADARSLYAYPAEQLPVRIYRIDLVTGHKETLREIRPFDAAGILNYPNVLLSADGRSYVYQLQRHLSFLYLAEHLVR